MGQSIVLYEISKEQFEVLAQNTSCFNEEMTEQYEVFDQNFDGILFLLKKNIPIEDREIIQEVFYPTDSIGESIDFDEIDFDTIKDDFIFQETLISYLAPNVWNDDEAVDSVFNKKYIEEGFTTLRSFFNDATYYESYIIMFVG